MVAASSSEYGAQPGGGMTYGGVGGRGPPPLLPASLDPSLLMDTLLGSSDSYAPGRQPGQPPHQVMSDLFYDRRAPEAVGDAAFGPSDGAAGPQTAAALSGMRSCRLAVGALHGLASVDPLDVIYITAQLPPALFAPHQSSAAGRLGPLGAVEFGYRAAFGCQLVRPHRQSRRLTRATTSPASADS